MMAWPSPNGVYTQFRTDPDSMDMAYDSAREVCVMFGGYDGSIRLADTWEYTLLIPPGIYQYF